MKYQSRSEIKRRNIRRQERLARLGTFVVDAVGMCAFTVVCLWVYAGMPLWWA